MLRSARPLPRGALLIRGPGVAWQETGIPDLRSGIRMPHRVRETNACHYPAFARIAPSFSQNGRRNSRFSTLPAPESGNGSERTSTLRGHL
jgi:hypothetical protein